ncbi:hypothetical protein EV121DRAFT_269555 [Schizophyllum commune]
MALQYEYLLKSPKCQYSDADGSSAFSVMGDASDDGVSEESHPNHPATLEDVLSEWADALAVTSQLREQYESLRGRCASDREVALGLHRDWLENHERYVGATEAIADGPEPDAASPSTDQTDVRAEVAAQYAHILELRARNASLYRAAAEERSWVAGQGYQSAVAVSTYLDYAIRLVEFFQLNTDRLEASCNDLRTQLTQSEQRHADDIRQMLEQHQRDRREIGRLRARHMHDTQQLGRFQEQRVRDVSRVATLRQDVLRMYHAIPPAGRSAASYGAYPASLSAPIEALPEAPSYGAYLSAPIEALPGVPSYGAYPVSLRAPIEALPGAPVPQTGLTAADAPTHLLVDPHLTLPPPP